MAYQVLYRKWRPQTFADVVGREAIVSTLRRQLVTGRVSHAYLFCGCRGTGKTSIAKIMSRAVNCLSPRDGDPCGECESCRRILSEECVDIQEIDAASNNGVDQVRELRENAKYPPQQSRYKVYIIDEVHMLSGAAFNALLKTLEEPPEHVLFLLATTEPEKLPATILSRCQRYDFGRLPVNKIAGRLREAADDAGVEATDEALQMLAVAAEGGMRDALSMLDMCIGTADIIDASLVQRMLGTTDRGFLFDFTAALAARDAGQVLRAIDTLIRSGRDANVFARDMAEHLRGLLMARSCPGELTSLLDVTDATAARYAEQTQTLDVTRLLKMLDLFNSLGSEMRWAGSPRAALEAAALKACLRTEEADAQALNDRIAELEAQLSKLASAAQSGALIAPTASAVAAKAPAVRKPAPPKSVTGDEAWNRMIDRLRVEAPGLFAQLALGVLAGREGMHFVWQPKSQENSSFVVGALNTEKNRSRIVALLSELTGAPCTFEARLTAPVQAETVTDNSAADMLMKTFGSENVEVR